MIKNHEVIGRAPNSVLFLPFGKKETPSPLKRNKNVMLLAGAGSLECSFEKDQF